MPSSRDKGARRERQAAELYEDAGYDVERATAGGFQSPDFFDRYDLIAIWPNTGDHEDFGPLQVRLVQVKANAARDVHEWMQSVAERHLSDVIQPEYAVCMDREGWRLLQPVYRDGRWTYETVVDERDHTGEMGDHLTDYLADSGVTA